MGIRVSGPLGTFLKRRKNVKILKDHVLLRRVVALGGYFFGTRPWPFWLWLGLVLDTYLGRDTIHHQDHPLLEGLAQGSIVLSPGAAVILCVASRDGQLEHFCKATILFASNSSVEVETLVGKPETRYLLQSWSVME